MDQVNALPARRITAMGPVSREFLARGITEFREAAIITRALPYGYNSGPVDALTALRDGFGTCTTKHGLIASLAEEIRLPVYKVLGVYAMDQTVVDGIGDILDSAGLPFVPALHCFLVYRNYRIDLTEGNCNGKKRGIEQFFFTKLVSPVGSEAEMNRFYLQWCRWLMLPGGPLFMPGLGRERVEQALAACTRVLKSNIACGLTA